MKITRIKIYGFGRWLNKEFKIDEELQVFLGLNEAGKSTIIAFIVGMLFGFSNNRGHHQNTYEPLGGGAYGGELNFSINQSNYLLVRRNRTSTVTKLYNIDLDEEIQNPNEKLAELLAPLTKETFQQVYGFSQLDLNEIIELDENELKRRLQEIGAVGAKDWRNLATFFEKKAQAMFAANSKTGKRPLNEKIKAYRTLIKQLQVAKQNFPEYRQLLQIKQLKENNLTEFEKQVKTQIELKQKLSSLQPLVGLYKEQQTLQHYVDTQKFSNISDELQQKITELTLQRDNLIEEINRLKQVPPVESDDQLLTFYEHNKQTLEELEKNLPAYQKNATEQKILEQQYQEIVQQINQLVASNIDRQSKQIPTSNSKPKYINLSFAALLSGIILLLPLSMLIKGILLILILVGGSWYWINQPKTTDSNQLSVRTINTDNQKAELQQKKIDLEQRLGMLQVQNSNFDRILIHLNLEKFGFDKQPDFQQNILQVHEFLNLIHAKQAQWATMNAAFNYQQQHLKDLEQQLLNVEAQIKAIYLGLKVNDEEDYYWQLSQQTIYNEQKLRLKLVNQQLSDENVDLLATYSDTTQLLDATTQSNQKIGELNQQISSLRDEITDLRVKLKALANDATVEKLTQSIANLQADILKNLEVYLAHSLAAQWIDKTLSATSANRFPQIMDQAKIFFEILTLGHYHDIKLVENELRLINSHEEGLRVEQLSKGASEQLYVALRLAFVVILKDLVKMPIIIDDAFVNFDDMRKQKSYELLKEISKNNQIIYVTADDRISDAIEQQKITML